MTKSHVPFVILIIAAIVIAMATIVESRVGKDAAAGLFYHAWWFRLMWAVLAGSGAWLMWKRHMLRNFPVCLLHVSFLVILAGAITTALSSFQGLVHLRSHEATRQLILPDGTLKELPFIIELDTFRVDFYAGTMSPSDFISQVVCRNEGGELAAGTISMNHIMVVDGYRLYQTSFDDDQLGSWLTATYDPYGTAITYAGYMLLAIAVIFILFGKKQGFICLLKHPALRHAKLYGMALFVFMSAPTMLFAQDGSTAQVQVWDGTMPVIPRKEADKLRTRQIVFNSRIVPFNTLAVDFVQKIYGRHTFEGLTAEQVLVSWQLNPVAWRHARIIRINNKNRMLALYLGLKGEYASFNDFFDADGVYRPSVLDEKERGTHSKMEQALRDMNEKIALIQMLENGTLIVPIPSDGSVQPLSKTKVQAELLYNQILFDKILFMTNITIGFLLFCLMLWRMLGMNKMTRRTRLEGSPFMKAVVNGSYGLLLLVTLFHATGYVLRWYVSGTIPLTNGYETMQFVALATLLITCALGRRFTLILPFGFLISGFTLLVSFLGQMNPQITSLMPVLQSPWLSSHVSLIMISYSLFAFITLNAVVALIVRRQEQVEMLTVLSRLLLYPAVLFLAVGIFLGAIWANVSWGSYWSWDPKEVWALVTMVFYGLAFHRQSLSWLRRPRLFHLYMLFCFLSVLMTYFGVNYVLGGMHSYA